MDIRPDTGLGLDLPASAKVGNDAPKKKKSFKASKKLVTLLIIIILLAAAAFLINQYTSINLFGGSGDFSYDSDSYYAVFLSNGQVYFGKIAEQDKRFTILEDIYYLQVSNPLQQVPPTGAQQQPQLTLVKLGNELHGPRDHMQLNNEHILFTEELKDDGRVVQAITEYKVSGDQTVSK